MNEKKNLSYVDVIKGLGIILMVLGHTSRPDIVLKIIQSFHMPLFFIISGFLYKKDKYKNKFKFLIKIKALSYLKPYVVIGGVCYIVYGLIIMGFDKGFLSYEHIILLKRYIIGLIYSRGTWYWMPKCSPIWFLTAMFFANIFFYFVVYSNKRYKQILSVILLFILNLLIIKYINFKLPFNIDSAILGCIFMYIGFCIRTLVDKISYKKNANNIKICKNSFKFNGKKVNNIYAIINILIFIFVIIGILGSFFNKIDYVSMDSIIYGNMILMLMGSLGLSFSLFLFVYFYLPKCRIIEFFGKNTVPILGFNYMVNLFLEKICQIIPLFYGIELVWYIEFILGIILLVPVIFLWKNLYEREKKGIS